MIKSGYRVGTGLNESFLQMRVIETGDSKLGPYKAIKSSDQNKLYDLKNELHQQLGTGNINTDIKKDVLYLYLTKSVDETKLAKLFSKYKINESVDMNESAQYKITGTRNYEGVKYIVVEGPNADNASFMNKLRNYGFVVNPSGFKDTIWIDDGAADSSRTLTRNKDLAEVLRKLSK